MIPCTQPDQYYDINQCPYERRHFFVSLNVFRLTWSTAMRDKNTFLARVIPTLLSALAGEHPCCSKM